jgi:uncharacterized protein (DUF488 family)
MPSTLYTVGHSTRTLREFLDLLQEAGIRRLVDVRRFPGSRRHPHFSKEPLAAALRAEGIAYRHEPALGGRRTSLPDSPNTAWRNAGFRACADHLATAEVREAIGRLRADVEAEPTTVMCAEAVPWRCHRQLIADVFVAGGSEVIHLVRREERSAHDLSEHARMGPDGVLRYPSPGDAQGELL